MHVRTGDIYLSVNKAIPVGLIANELVTNALKYACEDSDSGDVWIEMQKNGSQFSLKIWDEGVRLPEEIDILNPSTLALQIVSNLTRQIGGQIEVNNDKGTIFMVDFTVSSIQKG